MSAGPRCRFLALLHPDYYKILRRLPTTKRTLAWTQVVVAPRFRMLPDRTEPHQPHAGASRLSTLQHVESGEQRPGALIPAQRSTLGGSGRSTVLALRLDRIEPTSSVLADERGCGVHLSGPIRWAPVRARTGRLPRSRGSAGAELVVQHDGAAGGVVRDVRAHCLTLGGFPRRTQRRRIVEVRLEHAVIRRLALAGGDVEAVAKPRRPETSPPTAGACPRSSFGNGPGPTAGDRERGACAWREL